MDRNKFVKITAVVLAVIMALSSASVLLNIVRSPKLRDIIWMYSEKKIDDCEIFIDNYQYIKH